MKYFFILGTSATLSVAELAAVFDLETQRRKKNKSFSGDLIAKDVFILDVKEEISAQDLIKKIGGTIKIGAIIDIASGADKISLFKKIQTVIKINEGKKFYFGISDYTKQKNNVKALAMEIKKYLREKGVSSRWVVSREPTLSSVVVEQNKLISENGIEIVLLEYNPPIPPFKGGRRGVLIGQTLAVQPFKELAFRDYGRPARDAYSGMLPPKLSQIMINLALTPSSCEGEGGGDVKILDPFCGSGTILTEAMLMGHKNIIGADISKKAIEDTRRNIEWTKNRFKIKDLRFKMFNNSATQLSRFIKSHSVDAIITEPYLGPQRGNINVSKVKKELENLYLKSFVEFKKMLKPNGRIVMVWPVFHISHITYHISPNLNGFQIINPIPENLKNNKLIKLTERNTIIYGRLGQKIWREIVILKNKNPTY